MTASGNQEETIPNPNATIAGQPTNHNKPRTTHQSRDSECLTTMYITSGGSRDTLMKEALPARLTMIRSLREGEKRLEDEDLDLRLKSTDIKTVRSTLEDLDNCLR